MENKEKIKAIRTKLKSIGISSQDVSIKKCSNYAISVGFKNSNLSTVQKNRIYEIANSYKSTDIDNTTYIIVRDENTLIKYIPKEL